MPSFISQAFNKALKRAGLTKEELAYRVLPYFLLELIQRYLRVKTVGTRHIPEKGSYIIIANHSGFMGFDALMLGHQIFQSTRRIPHIIAHKLWFFRPEISVHAEKMGMIPATFENGLAMLETGEGLVLFPEGEEGNFKPSRNRYKLRRFRRGFVRLALMTGAPIIPAIVIGAEETNITLGQVRWAKDLLGIIIPIPFNVIPLPAKWKIKFLNPIRIEKDPEKAQDIEYVTKVSRQIRMRLQQEIHNELKRRGKIFL
ncbi:MAG: 1-acyl-sn-glycerol-3-phosphate acyltransferase [Deltaproteobacteria bacterium]|nr:1-acyl-sn-glycerol-3-phosphate acyltransferase [Deltaproteobacteria bacterium]MBI3294825.1 1-acyl-sn-glycerol-3-phosphate acyltransferase [Deltaproteobacteria bacterium]